MKPDEELPQPAIKEKVNEKIDFLIISWRFLKQPHISLPFLTALFYVCGYSYYDSTLSFWGLNSSLFPIPFDAVLLNAFTPSVIISLTISGVGILIFIGLVALALFVIFIKRNLNVDLDKELVKRNFSNREIANIFNYLLILPLFALCSSLLAFSYGSQGYETSKHLKAGFDRGEGHKVTITLQMGKEIDGEDTLNGYAIRYSEEHCAFYIDREVLVLPLSDIKSIISKPRKD